MAADATTTFAIDTRADAGPTDELAESLESVHDHMVDTEKEVKELQAGLRRLKDSAATNTAEFKAMRTELTAKKAAVAADQVALNKMAGSAAEATKKVVAHKEAKKQHAAAAEAAAKAEEVQASRIIAESKKAADEASKTQAKMQGEAKKAAEEAAARRTKEVEASKAAAKKREEAAAKEAAKTKEKADEEAAANRKATEAVSAKTAAISIGKDVAVGAAAIAAKAMIALYAAVTLAAVSFVAFGLQAADAARSAALLREATMGSAAGAAMLDAQISALAAKLPGARAGLEAIGLALARAELTGRALELAFSAVATTAAVMGSQAGSIIQGIAERAKVAKKFVLGAFDLKGTGLKIADVAQALAGRLKISFQAAMGAIQNGQVGMEVGLAALDDAVQKKFGAVAAKMKLALPAQLDKARDDLGRLFKDVKIEPFLVGLQSILGLLDENTATGQALKTVFEVMLNPLAAGFGEIAPYVKTFLKGAIVGALMLTIALLSLKNELKQTFAGVDVGIGMADVFTAGGAAVMFLAQGFIVAAGAALRLVQGVMAIVGVVSAVSGALSAIGANVGQSLASGMAAAKGAVMAAAQDLAAAIPGPIKKLLGIASPSRLLTAFGRFSGQGLVKGIKDTTPAVEDAATDMAQAPANAVQRAGAQAPAGGAARAGGARGLVIQTLNIIGVQGAEQLQDDGFLDKLVDALERATRAKGGGTVELVEVTV